MEQAPAGRGPEPVAFRFTGSGSEYFRIWITNLLLSILTLAIYSAWAKVRRNRCFCRNTRLADAAFDYHASPRTILCGRLLAVPTRVPGLPGYHALASGEYRRVCGAVLPDSALAGGVCMTFRARTTSRRNIRFDGRRSAASAAELRPGPGGEVRLSAAVACRRMHRSPGDVSSTSKLIAALPTMLVEASYSQAFEREADGYALSYLKSAHIDPVYFRNLLIRLEAGHHDGSRVAGYLSSHPPTAERLRLLGGSAAAKR